MRQATWQDARRILCIRLDSIGDVLMTTPALRALKDTRPDRRLTLLTSDAGAKAARLVPEIDDVWPFRAPWMKAATGTPAVDRSLVARLSAAGFDAAVIFTVFSQSPLPAAYLCYLAGVPLVLAHCHENPYQLLTDWLPDPEPQKLLRHEVRRQLDLVAAIGCVPRHERLSFAVPRSAQQRAARLLAASGVHPDRPLVVAHPGAAAASRRYPPERFAEALELIGNDDRVQLVLTGDPSEMALVESIRSRLSIPLPSLAGALALADLGAVIAAADVLLSNNTAPVHIAAALGTPVVDLYALTNPQHTPWGVEHRVLYADVPCRYCYKSACPAGHHDCLRRVEPEVVAAAVRDLLHESAEIVYEPRRLPTLGAAALPVIGGL